MKNYSTPVFKMIKSKGLVDSKNILLLTLYVVSFLAFLRLSHWTMGFQGSISSDPVVLAKFLIRIASFSVAFLYLFKYIRFINYHVRTPSLEMLLFLVVAFLSLTYTPDFVYSTFRLTEHIGFFVVSLVIVINLSLRTNNPNEVLAIGVRLILYGMGLLIGTVWLSVIFWPEYAFRHVIGEVEGLGGSMLDMHTLAIISSIVYSININRLFSILDNNKLINLALSVMMLVTIYLTHSRTALFIVLLATLVILYRTRSGILKLLLYAFLGIVAVVGTAMYLNDIMEYVLRGQSYEELLLLTERGRFWGILVSDTLFNRPFLGYGYQMLSHDGLLKSFNDYGYSISNAHNTFIQTFTGLGLIGFSLLSYHLLRVVISLRYVYRYAEAHEKNNIFELIIIFIICILASITQHGIVGMTTPIVPTYMMLIMLLTYLRLQLKVSMQAKLNKH
jgi:hypothetical protein